MSTSMVHVMASSLPSAVDELIEAQLTMEKVRLRATTMGRETQDQLGYVALHIMEDVVDIPSHPNTRPRVLV